MGCARGTAKILGSDIATNDDRRGGRLATDHLIGLGHRRIAHVTGSGGAARARERGYRAAMKTAGLPAVVIGRSAGTAEADGYHLAGQILDEQPDLTALFAANDTMAVGAAAAARERGRTIPGDLSVIGYDDSPVASSFLLPLTTVDGQGHAVGIAAAEALLARIENPERTPQTTLVQPALVLRTSTAPPP